MRPGRLRQVEFLVGPKTDARGRADGEDGERHSDGRSNMSQDELSDHARSVIDSNSYMALGTADEAGHPWVSPVWFATEDHRNFHWVSSPAAKHSRHLAGRPNVAIAIFDSASRGRRSGADGDSTTCGEQRSSGSIAPRPPSTGS
jgi:pyridoxine/pyridoxamine 5'-phosphate oxidase